MFRNYDEYRSHTYRHFNTKTCPECYVLLIQICDDEWFSLHTTSNCQHSHQFTTVHSDPDSSGTLPLVIKQELDPDINSYLKTDIEMNVTNGFHSVFIPHTNTDYQSIRNIQLNGDEEHSKNEMVEDVDKSLMKQKKGNRAKQKSVYISADEQLVEQQEKKGTYSVKDESTEQIDSTMVMYDEKVVSEKSHPKKRRGTALHSHRPKTFTCSICQKTLSSFYCLEDHMKSKHSGKTKRKHGKSTCDKSAVRHMCSVCGKQFPDRSNMRAHERTHFGIKTAACSLCGKQFSNNSGFRKLICSPLTIISVISIDLITGKHMKVVHEKVRSHSCDIDGCEWTFGHSGALKRHKARRHGLVTNPNKCPICSKEFPNSTYHLNRHLKAHANNTAKEYIPSESKVSKTSGESKESKALEESKVPKLEESMVPKASEESKTSEVVT